MIHERLSRTNQHFTANTTPTQSMDRKPKEQRPHNSFRAGGCVLPKETKTQKKPDTKGPLVPLCFKCRELWLLYKQISCCFAQCTDGKFGLQSSASYVLQIEFEFGRIYSITMVYISWLVLQMHRKPEPNASVDNKSATMITKFTAKQNAVLGSEFDESRVGIREVPRSQAKIKH